MVEARESRTLIPQQLNIWEVSDWEQGSVLLPCYVGCTRDNSLETEKWPCITLHLEQEEAWHQPCNSFAYLLHTNVPAILLISCRVFPLLAWLLPYLLFCFSINPSTKIELGRNFEVTCHLVGKIRMVSNRLMSVDLQDTDKLVKKVFQQWFFEIFLV